MGTIGLEYFVLEDVLGLEYHLWQLIDGCPVFCLWNLLPYLCDYLGGVGISILNREQGYGNVHEEVLELCSAEGDGRWETVGDEGLFDFLKVIHIFVSLLF